LGIFSFAFRFCVIRFEKSSALFYAPPLTLSRGDLPPVRHVAVKTDGILRQIHPTLFYPAFERHSPNDQRHQSDCALPIKKPALPKHPSKRVRLARVHF
jgi:hypothetical protein